MIILIATGFSIVVFGLSKFGKRPPVAPLYGVHFPHTGRVVTVTSGGYCDHCQGVTVAVRLAG